MRVVKPLKKEDQKRHVKLLYIIVTRDSVIVLVKTIHGYPPLRVIITITIIISNRHPRFPLSSLVYLDLVVSSPFSFTVQVDKTSDSIFQLNWGPQTPTTLDVIVTT